MIILIQKILHFQLKIPLILWANTDSRIKEIWKRINQDYLQSTHIIKISNFRIIPIVIGLLLCQVQACKSSNKKGCYVKVNKAERRKWNKGQRVRSSKSQGERTVSQAATRNGTEPHFPNNSRRGKGSWNDGQSRDASLLRR